MTDRRPGTRSFDYSTEYVLRNLATDIELFAETKDQDDLVDCLEGIREVLCRLAKVKP